MEETLMWNIRRKLAEMKYNDFPEIEEMEMYRNLEGNWIVTYKYNGKKYIISNEVIDEEA